MPTRLSNLNITKVALCARGMNPEAQVLLYKSAEEPSQKEAVMADDNTVSQADYDAMVAERDALKAELDATSAPPADEIDKSALPASVVKALEEAETLRADIEKMKAERRSEQFLAKAKDYSHIAEAAELAPVLEVLDRVAPEEAKTLDQALKAANARIAESGLFKELGGSGEIAAGDDPREKVEGLVKQAIESGLDRPAAIRKVMAANPELQEAIYARSRDLS